jgi:hypothetical protein
MTSSSCYKYVPRAKGNHVCRIKVWKNEFSERIKEIKGKIYLKK